MKSLLRISFLTLFLSFGLLNGLKAQEKYEFATVAYYPPGQGYPFKGLYVSISGKQFEETEVKKDQVKNVADFSILLNYVKGMTDNGWRVINSFSTSPQPGFTCMTFVLEKRTSN